jgi:hypothetical protein
MVQEAVNEFLTLHFLLDCPFRELMITRTIHFLEGYG